MILQRARIIYFILEVRGSTSLLQQDFGQPCAMEINAIQLYLAAENIHSCIISQLCKILPICHDTMMSDRLSPFVSLAALRHASAKFRSSPRCAYDVCC